MPTGYTAFIEDGQVTTLREWLAICTAAFDFDRRDTVLAPCYYEGPLPVRDQYYDRELKEALDEQSRLLALSPDEIRQGAAQYNDWQAQRYLEACESRRVDEGPYLAMQAKVVEWDAPEKLAGVKKFMLDQLKTSWPYEVPKPPEPVSPQEWHDNEIERAMRRVQIRREGLERSKENHAARIEWILAVRQAFEDLTD